MVGSTRRVLRGAVVTAVVLAAVAGYAAVTWTTFEVGAATSGPVVTTVTPPAGGADRQALLAWLTDAGVTAVVLREPASAEAVELVDRLERTTAVRPLASVPLDPPPGVVDGLAAAGYAGLHVRADPFAAGAPEVLDGLERLRTTTRELGLLLSVTVPPVEPFPGLATGTGLVLGADAPVHTARSHRRLAHRVDQLVVDLGVARLPTVSLSGSLARRLITATGEALAGIDVTMLVQAPPLDDAAKSLRAVRQALARGRGWPRQVGIAVPGSWLDDRRSRAALHDAWTAPGS